MNKPSPYDFARATTHKKLRLIKKMFNFLILIIFTHSFVLNTGLFAVKSPAPVGMDMEQHLKSVFATFTKTNDWNQILTQSKIDVQIDTDVIASTKGQGELWDSPTKLKDTAIQQLIEMNFTDFLKASQIKEKEAMLQPTGNVGLINPGEQVCFMNSSLQNLFGLPQFNAEIADKAPPTDSMAQLYLNLLGQYRTSNHPIYAGQFTEKMRQEFGMNQAAANYPQADPAEFLDNLFDQFYPTPKERSTFHFPLGLESQMNIYSDVIGKISIPNDDSKQQTSLESLLKGEETTPFQIGHLPAYYIFAINRSDLVGGKITNHVQFPITNLKIENPTENKKAEYNLTGVVLHAGPTIKAMEGHCVAYVKRNGSWYFFDDANIYDDSNVKTILDKNINEIANAEVAAYKKLTTPKELHPYILFYEKVKEETIAPKKSDDELMAEITSLMEKKEPLEQQQQQFEALNTFTGNKKRDLKITLINFNSDKLPAVLSQVKEILRVLQENLNKFSEFKAETNVLEIRKLSQQTKQLLDALKIVIGQVNNGIQIVILKKRIKIIDAKLIQIQGESTS